ncbi:T9SS type A sorting domain-containing protein [Paracrocinitomix mangrovi]|uniref:T9SS type A sorting domain-containing protein n=1 Tax=Paracrocinitomix mangrovi TaxID=2862509 RepID=UPI001C8E1833|nr:T9SS type A sorting domain-containing protein [Paracrocinitomix mangrovi]UKN00732.1 T9SS type A sorting domain-containing protein [Paracrocinitomix mangrovi]
MKNYLILLSLVFLGLSCEQNQQQESSSDTSEKGRGDIIPLMSEGNELDLGSRHAFNLLRLADPSTGEIPAGIERAEREFAATLPTHQYKAQTWIQRGPFNVGGRTRALTLDVADENVMLAGAVSGGIWKTHNGGADWTKVTHDLDPHSITSIAQDTRPGKEHIWYAGTGEQYAIVSQTTFEARYSGNGLLKSTDYGESWEPLLSTQSNTPNTYVQNGDMDYVWRVITDHTNTTEDVVLAAVYNGVFRSADGGDTWSEVLGFTQGGFSTPGSTNIDLIITPSGIIYCTMSSDGPDKGIYRSDDGGLSWTDIKPSNFPSSWGRMAMTVNPLDDNIIWMFGACSSGFGNGHGVFRYEYLSGDGSGTGGSWSNRSAQLPDASCTFPGLTIDIGQLSTQSSFDVHIGIHPVDTSVMYIAGTSIWRNKDAFLHDSTNTWIGGYQCSQYNYDDLEWNLSYPNHHPDQHYLTWLPSNPNVLINANDGGLYRTVDALADSVTWETLNNGYVTTQFYALAIEPGVATSQIIMGGLQDNGTWWTKNDDFDYHWKYIGSGDGMYGALTNGATRYITCKQRGKMYIKEIDGNGNVLAHERLDPENGPTTYNWANSLKLDPSNDNRLFWNGRTKLWRIDSLMQVPITGDRTNAEPNFWVEMDSSKVDLQAGIITDIEMCQSDSNRVWYGTTNAYVYRLDNAYENVDTATKVNISGDNFPNGAYVSCIAVNPFNSDEIVVTFANYNIPSIFVTDDGGQNWTDISGNLEENVDGTGAGPAVFWAEYYVDGTIFVGTSTGLYTTNFPDRTNTVWTLEPGIGNVPVDHMDVRTHDGFMAVATHGLGVFSTYLDPGYLHTEKIEKTTEGLVAYPTITKDWVTVKMPISATDISLYSLSGQLLYKSKMTGSKQIDVSTFNAGTYIIVASNKDQKWTAKVIKQ